MAAIVAGRPIPIDSPMVILSLELNPPPLPACVGEEDGFDKDEEGELPTRPEVEVPGNAVSMEMEPAAADKVEDAEFAVFVNVPPVVVFVVRGEPSA
jgi:hypothetical protein